MVAQTGCAIVGQSEDLAPADRVLYALRDVTATIDSLPLIVGSIVGKKLAAGPAALVYDVKVGRGAFMETLGDARELAGALVEVTRANGRSACALITAMDAPLGRTIGNALEVGEAIDLLRGEGPADLRELVTALGAEMLVLAGAAPAAGAGARAIERALDSGAALEVFARFVEAQGGDPRVVDDRSLLPAAGVVLPVPALEGGHLRRIDSRMLGELAVDLGAGRRSIEQEIDPGVGLLLHVSPGERVARGDPLLEIHARDRAAGDAALDEARAAFTITDEAPESAPLVVERVD